MKYKKGDLLLQTRPNTLYRVTSKYARTIYKVKAYNSKTERSVVLCNDLRFIKIPKITLLDILEGID